MLNKKIIIISILTFIVAIGIVIVQRMGVNNDIKKIVETNGDIELKQNEDVGKDYHLSSVESKENNDVQKKEDKYNEDIKRKAFITGSVVKPGVYEFKDGDRLIDGIKLAGGVTEEADINKVNLAVKLKDEGMYYIPMHGEEIPDTITSDFNHDCSNDSDGKININKANSKELESIPGIGSIKADAIIEYREKNNGFKTINEIVNVKGIGQKTYEKLKDSITV